jgi:fused signal recognition particle receptor
MGWLDRLSEGLARTRERFTEQLNVIFDRGPALNDEFWDTLEESLILGDFGGPATLEIIEQLQEATQRLALPDGYAVFDRMADTIAALFTPVVTDPLEIHPVCVLFVGINGSGKTTTVGKLAKDGVEKGRHVLLGSADTFRAAAIEQLDIWAERAEVPVVKRERGADPASVSFEVIERAEADGADLVLIDTAGRLHTSDDLMRELEKVVKVTRKRAGDRLPVKTGLVIDATTGQNGLQQAREFNRALALDGVIVTKLDGTAKGGIAVAISHELSLPVLRIGVGERIDDLRPFDPHDFARALIGDSRADQSL